jgi:hypothetical protein
MQTWIVILRNWSLYARRREAAGVTGYSGASYARSLIQDGFDEAARIPEPLGIVLLMVTTGSRTRWYERHTCRAYTMHCV